MLLSVITFDYANYRGVTSRRRARPVLLWHGKSEYYEGEHYFLKCFDLDKGADRDFMLTRMLNVEECSEEAPPTWADRLVAESRAGFDGVFGR